MTSGERLVARTRPTRSRQDAQAGAQEIDIQLQNALEKFRFM